MFVCCGCFVAFFLLDEMALFSCRLRSKPESLPLSLSSTHLYLHDRSSLNFFLGLYLHLDLAQPHASEEAPCSSLGMEKGEPGRVGAGGRGRAGRGLSGRQTDRAGLENEQISHQSNQPISLGKERRGRAGKGAARGRYHAWRWVAIKPRPRRL